MHRRRALVHLRAAGRHLSRPAQSLHRSLQSQQPPHPGHPRPQGRGQRITLSSILGQNARSSRSLSNNPARSHTHTYPDTSAPDTQRHPHSPSHAPSDPWSKSPHCRADSFQTPGCAGQCCPNAGKRCCSGSLPAHAPTAPGSPLSGQSRESCQSLVGQSDGLPGSPPPYPPESSASPRPA